MELNPYNIAAGALFVAFFFGGVLPKLVSDQFATKQALVVNASIPLASVASEQKTTPPEKVEARGSNPPLPMIEGGPKLPGIVGGVTLNGKSLLADEQPPELQSTMSSEEYYRLRNSRN